MRGKPDLIGRIAKARPVHAHIHIILLDVLLAIRPISSSLR